MIAGLATPATASFSGANGQIAAAFSFDDSHPCGDMGGHICEGDSYSAVRLLRPRTGGSTQLFRCLLCALASPAWSPSGNRIAFADGDFRLHTADATGHHDRQLDGPSGADPAWSPDAKSLVFVANDGAVSTIPARGGNARTVVPAPITVRDSGPVWCSNGRIVFTRSAGLVSDVYSVRPDGRGLKRIARGTATTVDCGAHGQVLYSTAAGTYTIRTDGLRRRKLFDRLVREPVLAPDGRSIAYVDRGDVWTVRVDGRDRRNLTVRGKQDFYSAPAWQPRPRR
jgi:Tol biopolymer transport system component